ncbi:hypothetical protein [Halobellus ruber]|uniref:Zinc finger FPG/IleRS-type domain-containing protein n=1 Tax=Halobellus ruber TaxID=2761102 RepID=A0A7J9SKK8_9EURY|nr:hypothetical protein [Halobellus ruber]MBB6646537.1 hypothetical protein [Halobellus ruber]
MDCPRCGTRLTRISLNGEVQSVYCEQCRFADVESDHTRVSDGEETWDDALRRFRRANAETDGESNGDVAGERAPAPDDAGEASESEADAESPPAGDPDPEGATDAADADRGDGSTDDDEAGTEDGTETTASETESDRPADAEEA